VPVFGFVWLESLYFCELGVHAKFLYPQSLFLGDSAEAGERERKRNKLGLSCAKLSLSWG
jgi:hypothetical protein